MRWVGPGLGMSVAMVIGCSTEPNLGTAVGNPGSGLTVKTSGGPGIDAMGGSFTAAEVQLRPCTGAAEVVARDLLVDAAGGTTIDLPDGDYCGVAFVVDGVMALEGTGSGHTLTLSLDVGRVDVWTASGFTLEEDALTVYLGASGWLDAGDLKLDEADVSITPADGSDHRDLVEAVRTGSFLVDAAGTVLAEGNEGSATDDTDVEDDTDDDDTDDTDG